jgi:hypothetical protein
MRSRRPWLGYASARPALQDFEQFAPRSIAQITGFVLANAM